MEALNLFKDSDEKAQALLKEFEGLASSSPVRLKYLNFQGLYPDHTLIYAYKDSGGLPTIGWGTTHYPKGAAVQMGDTCTIKQAREYFLHEYNLKKEELLKKLPRPQTANQVAALTSLMYNIGRNAFFSSTLFSKLKNNDSTESVASEFTKWVFDNGTMVQGLVNRRKKEKEIYLS